MKRLILNLLIWSLGLASPSLTVTQFSSDPHGTPSLADSIIIQMRLAEVVQAVRQGRSHALTSFFKPGLKVRKTADFEHADFSAFDVAINGLTITGREASAMLSVDAGETLHITNVSIVLEKKGDLWFISSGDEFGSIVGNIMANSALAKNGSLSHTPKGDAGKLSSTQYGVSLSQYTLLPTYNPGSTRIHTITSTLANNATGQSLFSKWSQMESAGVLPSSDATQGVAFYVDPAWGRIIFGQMNGNWVSSYGDHAGEQRFGRPGGIVADQGDTLFVQDETSANIAKLFYNSALHSITYVGTLGLTALSPYDVSIDNANTCDPADDRIWISSKMGGVYELNRAGVIQASVKYYTYAGQTYMIPGGARIVASNMNPNGASTQTFLAFTDHAQNAFVTADIGTLSGTTVQAYSWTQFANGYTCSHVGQDRTGNFWASDSRAKMVHTFYLDGTYLASYNSDPLVQPTSISKRIHGSSSDCSSSWDFNYLFVNDAWDANSGINAYFLGADAVNMSLMNSGTQYSPAMEASFTLTNSAKVISATIDRDALPYQPAAPGLYAIIPPNTPCASIGYVSNISAKGYPTGKYHLKLVLQPLYWDNSPLSNQTTIPITKDVSFYYVNQSFTGYIGGNTNLASGVSSTYTMNVSGGTGHYSFQWATSYNQATWSNQGTGSTQSVTMQGQDIYLQCVVIDLGAPISSNSFQQVSATFHVAVGTGGIKTGGSCPFVATWADSQYVLDNNILPHSEMPDSVGADVTDYYRLLQPETLRDSIYSLLIEEFENEQSSLDQFRLFAVDHLRFTKIDVGDDGTIYEYYGARHLHHASVSGQDVTTLLAEFDSIGVVVAPGDTVFLSTPPPNNGKPSTGGGAPGTEVAGSQPIKNAARAKLLTKHGNRVLDMATVSLNFRENPTLTFTPIVSQDSSTTDWMVIFAQQTSLNYITRAKLLDVPSYVKTELPLLSAVHSSAGDVTSALDSLDGDYASLNPGESIELQFAVLPQLDSTMRRDFILESHGWYVTLHSDSTTRTAHGVLASGRPLRFSLNPNYPNPFNPSTVFSYELARTGNVTLKIYDLLGRCVSTLVNKLQSEGDYNVNWNASNFASGLYFARIAVTSSSGKPLFTKSRKVLLVK